MPRKLQNAPRPQQWEILQHFEYYLKGASNYVIASPNGNNRQMLDLQRGLRRLSQELFGNLADLVDE